MEKTEYLELRKKYSHLKPSIPLGLLTAFTTLALLGVGIYFSSLGAWSTWIFGQILMGIAFLRAFVMVHDLAHNAYFKSPLLNTLFGQVFSLVAFLPYFPWQSIHAGHHKWVGYKDLDPTMEQTVDLEQPTGKKRVMNVCWYLWIPVFSLSFSFGNFWNIPKLFRLYPSRKLHFVWSVGMLVAFYGGLAVFFTEAFFYYWGFSYFLFLFVSDPLLLSQHAHVPQERSNGEKMRPKSLYEQEDYTRQLLFPRWASEYLLLNFDAHIAHHLFPGIPCYKLGAAKIESTNQTHWWTWLKRAKKMPAYELLFIEEPVPESL